MKNNHFRVFAVTLTLLGLFLSQLCLAQGVAPGTIKWKYALDPINTWSTIAIGYDNTILVPARDKLLGINPNGTLKWTFQGKPDDDIGPPSIGVNGNIYITEFSNGYRPVDNGIYALNNQGLQLWTFTTNFHPADGMSSALAVDADSNIYAYGNNDDTSQSSLYAISPDGSFKWRSERAQYAPAITSTGILYSARIYGSGLVGLNPSDGQPTILSNTSIGSYWQLPSIGPNGDIYFINNYDLKAFRSDGTFLWSYVHGGTFAIQPGEAVTGANGVIYFSSYDYNRYISRVHALNPDGTLNWMYVFETGSTVAQGSPAIGNDGVIYIATGASTSGISAFNPEGSLLWQLKGFRTRLSLFNSPILGPDGTLYIIGEEPDSQNNYHPFLYAVNTSSTGPANSSWPMWGANAQHTRVVNSLSPPPPQPVLSVTPPSSLDFGPVTVGTSKDFEFTIKNVGGGTLTGTATTNAAPFSIFSGSSISLDAGASQPVVVRFSPTVTGPFTGTVNFETNGGNTSQTVTGTGAVIPVPLLGITPTTLDFASVAVGSLANRTVIIKNTGEGTLEGTCTTTTPFSLPNGCSFNLTAGQSKVVNVRFSPTVPGPFEILLRITSNTVEKDLSLRGIGFLPSTKEPVIKNDAYQGIPGGQVTLNGRNFGPYKGTLTVNGVLADIQAWNDTFVTFVIPDLAPGTLYCSDDNSIRASHYTD